MAATPVASKALIGIGNVDNTSDADKPVSTATQAALDLKAALSHTHAQSDITGLVAALAAKLDASGYTAADVLAKLLTVDGTGTGLDADLLDGSHSADLIPSVGVSTGTTTTAHYFHPLAVGSANTTRNADEIEFVPIPLNAGVPINWMQCWVRTPASEGKKSRFGIYSNVAGKPGSLLVDAGEFLIDSAAVISVAINWTVPKSGWYWAAMLNQEAVGLHSLAPLPGVVGARNFASMGSTFCYTARLYPYGPLPATAPNTTSETRNVPAIALRWAS